MTSQPLPKRCATRVALPIACLALACGCASDDVGNSPAISESGWLLHGAVADAATALPVVGASVATGFSYEGVVDWRSHRSSDSTGTYVCGADLGCPDSVRFSKTGYDTLVVAFDSAVEEVGRPYTRVFRYDARLQVAGHPTQGFW